MRECPAQVWGKYLYGGDNCLGRQNRLALQGEKKISEQLNNNLFTSTQTVKKLSFLQFV
jgi:hypothetical protein